MHVCFDNKCIGLWRDLQGCGGKPDGLSADQEALKQAAEDLRTATHVVASSCVVRKQTLGNLQVR